MEKTTESIEQQAETPIQDKPKFWTKRKIIIAAAIVLLIAAAWIFVYSTFSNIGGQPAIQMP